MNRMRLILCAALSVTILLAGCTDTGNGSSADSSQPATSSSAPSSSTPQTPDEIAAYNRQLDLDSMKLYQYTLPDANDTTALIKTDMGELHVRLFPDEAPLAVENFVTLANEGYYDGLSFFEVFPGVRVSTGAPDNAGDSGKTIHGEPFANELSLNLWHFNGALATYNDDTPGQNDSRFYIVENASLSEEELAELEQAGFPQKVIEQYAKRGGVPGFDQRDTVFGQVYSGSLIVSRISATERDNNNVPLQPVRILSVRSPDPDAEKVVKELREKNKKASSSAAAAPGNASASSSQEASSAAASDSSSSSGAA